MRRMPLLWGGLCCGAVSRPPHLSLRGRAPCEEVGGQVKREEVGGQVQREEVGGSRLGRHQGRHQARHQGFSLLEAILAVAILSVGLVGLMEGMTLGIRGSREAEKQTVAALLAAGHMETIRAEGLLIEGSEEGDFGETFSTYSWSRSLNQTPLDGLFEVVVRVKSAESRQLLYELRTLLFDIPPRLLDTTPRTRSQAREKGYMERMRRD